MKVLVADDERVSRIMLQHAVEDLGHECPVAENCDEAWALIRSFAPDVLITDRVMPGLDGLELCRRPRKGHQLHLRHPRDLPCREGGAGAVIAAERIRSAVQEPAVPHAGAPAGVVTISVGVAACDPSLDTSAESVLRRADAALYQAKSEGRNRIVFSDADRTPASATAHHGDGSPRRMPGWIGGRDPWGQDQTGVAARRPGAQP